MSRQWQFELQRPAWTDDRRARASAYHRKRHGAPDGYCTIYGVHVPFEHRDPVRYWADRQHHQYGREATIQFIQELKENDWRDVPRLRALFDEKRQIHRNTETIREIEWEAHRRADQDSR